MSIPWDQSLSSLQRVHFIWVIIILQLHLALKLLEQTVKQVPFRVVLLDLIEGFTAQNLCLRHVCPL
jgi:hypothetical protein